MGEPPVLPDQEQARLTNEVKITQNDTVLENNVFQLGQLSALTCPECHGSLVSIQEGTLIRYRCHTGHGFTAKSLLSGVNQTIEDSLWNAIRALEEALMLLEQTAQGLEEGDPLALDYQSQIAGAREKLATLRPLVMSQ